MNYALTFISIFFSYFVFSQDTLKKDSSVLIENIIISYQAVSTTPNTFQNITKREIDEKSIGQEPSFLLSSTPSVTNYSDAGSGNGYSYFRMRGIDQTRVNISLDGVPLNEPEDQGAYFSNYPDLLNSMSKIQIQRGVGTSKNGVASYAGSVQLFSPNLRDSAFIKAGVSYGSFNSFRIFGEYNSGVKNNKALYIRASEVYSDGYKYRSRNNSQSIFLSSALFREKSIWKLNALIGHQQNQLAWLGVSDSLINLDRRNNANSSENDEFMQSLIQLQNNWNLGQKSKLQTSIYHTFLSGNYDFDFNNFIGLPSTNELYNYAFQSNLLGFFSNYILTKNNFNWTNGVHANTYARTHIGSEKSIGKLYENTGYKSELSAFSKIEYELPKYVYLVDLQFRTTTFYYKGFARFEQMNWNFFNPKAGISYLINQQSKIYISVGKTSREATRNDLFYGNDDLPADSLGNGIINQIPPEEVIDYEFGFHLLKKRFEISTNFYFMDFKNEIVLDGKFGPNGIALTNKVEKSIRAGIEFSTSYQITKYLKLINNSSYNYSEIKQQNTIFSPILTPNLIVNQEVNYQYKKMSATLSVRYQSKSFIDYANTATINDYFLLNCRLSYELKKTNFSLFLNNILNTKYVNQAYIDFDGTRKSFVQAPFNVACSIVHRF